jgi:Ca-activated chloride channel homolog
VRPRHVVLSLALASALAPLAAAPALAAEDPVLWPEEQRAFLQDGPALLLPESERASFAALDAAARARFIAEFLGRDPLPATPENELALGIARRQQLAAEEFLSPLDVRAQLLFLNGKPAERLVIDCGQAFKPLEIWGYDVGSDPDPEKRRRELLVYRPLPTAPWQLWRPAEGKRAIYSRDMEKLLDDFEALRGQIRAVRFDLQVCEETPRVDKASGVNGLFGFRKGRPTGADFERFLAPPEDLGAWAAAAAKTALPAKAAAAAPPLALGELQMLYPARRGQRVLARALLTLPPGSARASTPPTEKEKPELRLTLQGMLEQDGRPFEEFRLRFRLEPPAEGVPVALALERALRPGAFLLRFDLKDDVSGARVRLARGFQVPREPAAVAEPPVPDDVVVALGEDLALERPAGRDSLILVPPEEDVVLGLWRAEALVSGGRIVKVVFLVDGAVQLTRVKTPFSAEVRLAEFPVEQVVRAEGYDEQGELVAADEVVVNQPRGALQVTILAPGRGVKVSGQTLARAEISVPEGKRIESVDFRVNDATVASLVKPPWQAQIEVPVGGEVAYLTVVATLDDGSRAEDTRFLNAPPNLDRVDVTLVELYTTVFDRGGQPALGLTAADFEVLDGGAPQTITKFELVEDLPLSVGLVIDTSGSMASSLVEAQRAAADFVRDVVTPRDRSFVVSFSDKPVVLMPPTDDRDGVIQALTGLQAVGYTALHDALVTSLYYFRGVRGQRALVLLSDGDDTASHTPYRNALEYARRSGVAIYTIGLAVSPLSADIRNKLTRLSNETGGRAFFVEKAGQLVGVYEEIEKELRSRYYLAYAPTGGGEGFREVEVRVRGGLKARTIRGYYP